MRNMGVYKCTHLSLQLLGSLTNQRGLVRAPSELWLYRCFTNTYMVNKTVLRRIVFCLESTEQGFLRSKDLDSACRVLRQAHQATSMADEPRANKLANQRREVRSNSVHSVPQVLCELCSVRSDRNDLVA
jgi:hypothetical protein